MSGVVVAEALIRRLRQPRILVAAILIGLTAGIVLAFLVRRGELAGSDAFAYWTAFQRWLAGSDIYLVTPSLNLPPSEGALPYAYAPWTVPLFAPWAVLPWDVAWFLWRAAEVILFGLSAAWAYARRPLATALLLALVGPALAANLDTGNIGVFVVLAVWATWWAGPRLAGSLWALATALKWVPLVLIVAIPRRARGPGLLLLALAGILTLATWPLTLRQLDIVFSYPRPLRIDYMLFAWALVPWLWSQPWPPWWLYASEWRRHWRQRLRSAVDPRRLVGSGD
jgi:hypothetical protein